MHKIGDKVKLNGTIIETLTEGRYRVKIGGDTVDVGECAFVPESVLTEDDAPEYSVNSDEAGIAIEIPASEPPVEHIRVEPTGDAPVEAVNETVAEEVGVPFSAVAEPAVEPVKQKRGRKKQ